MTDDAGGERSRASLSRAFTHRTSLATRLSAAALSVSLLSLVGLLVFSSGTITQGTDRVLRQRLSDAADVKAGEIENHLRLLQRRLTLLAETPTAGDSIDEFGAAFQDLAEADASSVTGRRASLRDFYLEDFVPALGVVRGRQIDAGEVAPEPNVATIYLQAEYIADNPLPPAQRSLYVSADDGSDWTEVHTRRHPFWQATAERMGFADLYLIEPDTRTIVYSVSKDVDFATSLETGPFGDTGLATVTGLAGLDPRPGEVVLSDLATHAPALDEPSLFVAAAVFDGPRYAGLVVARTTTDAIDRIMTREWRAGRLGETGETYLVGADDRMRSVSRPFVEDRASFLETVDEIGIDPADRRGMLAHDTTALFLEAATPIVDDAFDGVGSVREAPGYLGVEVLGVGRQVDVEGIDWAVVAQQTTSEVEAPIASFFRTTLIITGVFVVALTFLMVAWANRFAQPIRDLGASLEAIRRGNLDVEVPVRGAAEFRRLGDHFSSMLDRLRTRRAELIRARQEKADLLGMVLPPAAAESVERGDRRLLQTTPAVSVVVVVLDGLDELVRGRSTEENRDLVHRLLDEADLVADAHGLTRIKVMGDTYFAACGIEIPYLDHAPRAVAFAEQIREAVRGIAREVRLPLGIRAGVHSGPVTVGLVGDARLVYDLWGDTVTTAYRVARLAHPGQVLVSDGTRDRLPPGTETVALDSDEPTPVWEVTVQVQEVPS